MNHFQHKNIGFLNAIDNSSWQHFNSVLNRKKYIQIKLELEQHSKTNSECKVENRVIETHSHEK